MGSYKELISSVMTTFVIVNAIALAARVYVRLFIVNAFGHDDWMLLLTYVSVCDQFQRVDALPFR